MSKNTMTWKTEKRKVSDLKDYEANPRKMSADKFALLKKSIDELGYIELVAINADNTILAGHMRVRALRDLGRGDEEIEVRVPPRQLTKEEAERYLIESNKVTGDWDWDMLANSFEPEFLESHGFSPVELGMDPSGKENVDKDKINESLDSYLESDIKQIVLYFKGPEYQQILDRLEKLMKAQPDLKDYSELFLSMLEMYEGEAPNA